MGTPITVAKKTATNASSIVAGSRAAKRSATGAACLSEKPKSPCTALLTNRQNCTQPESLSPNAAVKRARSATEASTGSIWLTGSPTN